MDARLGDLVLHTDQPVSDGGDGSAPSPFMIFLGSLAACAGFYALEFCQSRQLSMEGLGVTLHATRNEEKKLFDQMRIELKLPVDFPEKYKAAIVRAVDLCTVKKHIMHSPNFETVVV